MENQLPFLVIIVILAWTYDFFNGMNDCANAIATTVSTRALSPRNAILLARTFNFVGALVTTEVAKTIGKGIVDPSLLDSWIIIAALLGAIAWAATCTLKGLPISVTHSLIGGMVGSVLISKGPGVLKTEGLVKILVAMVVSPLAGLTFGFFLLVVVFRLFRRASPEGANRTLRFSQLLSASYMAFAHGSNDAQNAMGIITAALVSAGFLHTFKVPLWVILGSAFFMGLGTHVGGWRVIRTMGMKMTKLRPAHGFSAETAAASAICICTLLGLPISTTHVISTAIIGAGAAERVRAVKWGVTIHIVLAWILTIPGSAVCAALICALFGLFR